jgi:hypothetical protein
MATRCMRILDHRIDTDQCGPPTRLPVNLFQKYSVTAMTLVSILVSGLTAKTTTHQPIDYQ